MKVPYWKIIVQGRTKWKGVVAKTKTLRELWHQRGGGEAEEEEEEEEEEEYFAF
jgi:hypothetical protein